MLEKLVDIVKILRSPGGCPWDIEQTFQSLRPHIIEEAYELADVMEREDLEGLREELGDVLLHVVMVSRMAAEKGVFGVSDVIDDVCQKMIRRHPHVFGEASADTVEDVWQNWEAVKKKERQSGDLFASIPMALPALMKANKVQKRASREGFDWKSNDGSIQKVEEERQELIEAMASENQQAIQEECGDLLFSVVNAVRKCGVEPEQALNQATRKFIHRYQQVAQQCQKNGRDLKSLSEIELAAIWETVKKV